MPLRLRHSISRRGARTYRYYQLVRAVRKNGKPTHDVIAHIGRLEEAEAKAIQKALDELYGRRTAESDDRVGKAVVALEDVVGRATPRYLDVMVVHRIWQQWGFREFFNAHLRKGRSLVAPADVVEVLVVNRCLAPCSKLRVTEWAPRTVLPEVLDFRPEQLNNTRIHRVLKRLEEIESEVSRFIIQHARRREPTDSVIYLDITDTWFEGRGGDLAAPGKCKDGAIRRRRIQIALGVDARGLPLRWDVLAGNASEGEQLPKWIEAVAEHPEFEGLPLVFDRGFSSADNLRVLIEAGRQFVTCAKKPRVADWDFGVDFESIACTPVGEMPSRKQLEEAGLWPVEGDEDVYYVDHGVRLPHRMDPFYAPGLRTVLFFRRSLFIKQTEAVEKVRQKLHDAVAKWNKDLANAKKSRSEEKTRKKVEAMLKHYGFQFDYRVRLQPIELVGKSSTIHSFKIYLDPIEHGTKHRAYNAGWMVLLAHPDDTRPAPDLIRQYVHKEAVENAFKTIKSFVELKPINHQTTPKIRAHVTLCMLGLLLDRDIELQLRAAGIRDSIDRVYEALEPCRLHVIAQRGRRRARLIVSEYDEHQWHLLGALRLEKLLDDRTTKDFSRSRL